MKTIKVSEATELQLDWLVAKCEGKYYGDIGHEQIYIHNPDGTLCCPKQHWKPTTKWTQGGPIIEREKISLEIKHDGWWLGSSQYNYSDEKEHLMLGKTPLIAAMRCYVASKMGDEVQVPEEL